MLNRLPHSPLTLFDVLGNILHRKSLSLYQEHIQDIDFDDVYKSAFLVEKWLSMTPDNRVTLALAKIQPVTSRLGEEQTRLHYLLMLKHLPKVPFGVGPSWIKADAKPEKEDICAAFRRKRGSR